jgi:membrane fusion protein (multidrug efflux system)
MNEHVDDAASADADVAPNRKRRWLRPVLLILGPTVVIIGGAYWYYSGGRYVETENAYVHADMVAISPQVSGQVADVLVHENQHVQKGDVLFKLDRDPFTIAVEHAQANLSSVRQDMNALKQSYAEQQGSLELAKIKLKYAERTYARQSQLSKKNVVSKAAFDDAQNAVATAKQQIVLDRQIMQTTLAKLDGAVDTPVEQLPQYQQAKANLDQAELDLAHTVIKAPFEGVVSNKPEPGAYITPGKAVASLISTKSMWIDANFKEVELTYLETGQAVSVTVDAYPDHAWKGVVQSVSPATGAEFSVLPAQNATGNWVKVVQRISVRIKLEMTDGQPTLRAGMSTVVQVDTHHKRELPAFAQTALSWVGINQAEARTSHTGRSTDAGNKVQ